MKNLIKTVVLTILVALSTSCVTTRYTQQNPQVLTTVNNGIVEVKTPAQWKHDGYLSVGTETIAYNKTTNCSCFSTIYYKRMSQLGYGCRIVVGTIENGNAHSEVMVKTTKGWELVEPQGPYDRDVPLTRNKEDPMRILMEQCYMLAADRVKEPLLGFDFLDQRLKDFRVLDNKGNIIPIEELVEYPEQIVTLPIEGGRGKDRVMFTNIIKIKNPEVGRMLVRCVLYQVTPNESKAYVLYEYADNLYAKDGHDPNLFKDCSMYETK